MINKFIFKVIKFLTNFLKKTNLDKFFFDKVIFNVGLNQISENRKNYENVKNIQEIELKVFSQNGEDGIIDYILTRLGLIPNSTNFVEIGVGNYRESNTRFIYNRFHPKGIIIDCIDDMEHRVKPHVNMWKGDLRICNKKIDADNINEILKNNCNYEIDVFSLDIDSIDYWIIDKLQQNISKIFIAEYNPVFGPDLKVTVPNIKGFDRTKYHYSNLCYGMSLRALIDIMKTKNYYFIGTNLQKMNAFFISNDFKKNQYFDKINTLELNEYTNSNIRDSRDINYKLNFLTENKKLKEIENCEVINLENKNQDLIKIKDLL
tara:strand:+ start:4240 stop:5196 length:957 start_codon:yes stop_codon:yes gene_type:complete